MSAPVAAAEIRTVLACVRRIEGVEAAFWTPLGATSPPLADGADDAEAEGLLGPEERVRLRGGRPLVAKAAGRPLASHPVLATDTPALGALSARLAEGRSPADALQGLRELAGLLGHALRAAAEHAEEGEFSRFFSLSIDNTCIAGFDGYFKLLSPSWEHTLGYTLDELYARPYVDFVHPDDRQATLAEREWLARGGQTITFSNRYVRKDGSLCYLEWRAAPSTERKRVYAVARDVTEAKRVAEELRSSRAAAEAASQAKSAFLAMMSHELRTPLNSVIGFSDLLLKNATGNLSAEELDYARRIRANGRDLLGLINSILDLSRIEAGRIEPELAETDLAALARDVVRDLAGTAPRGVELVVQAPDRPVPFVTDASRLRQILANLIGNGLKFTRRGAVTLRLELEGGEPRAFVVEDTGPGIPPEDVGAIFEPFRQLEQGSARNHGGSGLGLAISRSFADALGFGIEVSSEVGVGTRFSVLLRS